MNHGLSVTGVVRPDRMYPNNGGRPGDRLVLSKGAGHRLICSARKRVGETSEAALAARGGLHDHIEPGGMEVLRGHTVHACTDVTGFGLLGHLHEMMDGRLSCVLRADRIPAAPTPCAAGAEC